MGLRRGPFRKYLLKSRIVAKRDHSDISQCKSRVQFQTTLRRFFWRIYLSKSHFSHHRLKPRVRTKAIKCGLVREPVPTGAAEAEILFDNP